MPAIADEGDLKRDLGLKLSVIVRGIRKGFEKSVGELGVTRSQWTLVLVVMRRPGATQRMIAEALEMSEASAGRLIDRLCGEGLLERRVMDHDRRAHSIHLTVKSKPLLGELARLGQKYEAETFAGFSDAELRQFSGLLDKVYANVVGVRPGTHDKGAARANERLPEAGGDPGGAPPASA